MRAKSLEPAFAQALDNRVCIASTAFDRVTVFKEGTVTPTRARAHTHTHTTGPIQPNAHYTQLRSRQLTPTPLLSPRLFPSSFHSLRARAATPHHTSYSYCKPMSYAHDLHGSLTTDWYVSQTHKGTIATTEDMADCQREAGAARTKLANSDLDLMGTRRPKSLVVIPDILRKIGRYGMHVHCGYKSHAESAVYKPVAAMVLDMNASLTDYSMCEQRRDQDLGYKIGAKGWYGHCVLWWQSEFIFRDGIKLSRERGCSIKTAGGPLLNDQFKPLSAFQLTNDGKCMQTFMAKVFGNKGRLAKAMAIYDDKHACKQGAIYPLTYKLFDTATCQKFWALQSSAQERCGAASSHDGRQNTNTSVALACRAPCHRSHPLLRRRPWCCCTRTLSLPAPCTPHPPPHVVPCRPVAEVWSHCHVTGLALMHSRSPSNAADPGPTSLGSDV